MLPIPLMDQEAKILVSLFSKFLIKVAVRVHNYLWTRQVLKTSFDFETNNKTRWCWIDSWEPYQSYKFHNVLHERAHVHTRKSWIISAISRHAVHNTNPFYNASWSLKRLLKCNVNAVQMPSCESNNIECFINICVVLQTDEWNVIRNLATKGNNVEWKHMWRTWYDYR